MGKTFCTLTEEQMLSMFVVPTDPPNEFLDPARAEIYADERLEITIKRGKHTLPYAGFINLPVGVVPFRVDPPYNLQEELAKVVSAKDFDKRVDHARKAMEKLQQGRDISNGPTVRIAGIDNGIFVLQPATYFDQCQTNLVADAVTSGQFTMRSLSYDRNTKKLHSLRRSPLANTLGVAAVVHFMEPNKNERIYFAAVRNPGSAVFNRLIGQVSGVVDAIPSSENPRTIFVDSVPGLEFRDNDLRSLLFNSILKELIQEIGFRADAVRDVSVLRLGRELLRAGKPQAFLDIELEPMTEAEFEGVFSTARQKFLSFEPSTTGNRLTSEHLTNFALHRVKRGHTQAYVPPGDSA